MMQLHQDYDKFLEKNTIIVAVGPEDGDGYQKYWTDHGLKFYGIPDPNHSVLKLYGQKVNLFKLGRMPAQMLIDRAGVLRYVHYGHSMSDIPQNSELFELIKTM